MLGLKLNHVSKIGHRYRLEIVLSDAYNPKADDGEKNENAWTILWYLGGVSLHFASSLKEFSWGKFANGLSMVIDLQYKL